MRTIKNFYRKYLHNWVGFCVAVAFSLNIFIETLARQNFLAGFIFFFESPMTNRIPTKLVESPSYDCETPTPPS